MLIDESLVVSDGNLVIILLICVAIVVAGFWGIIRFHGGEDE
jgi:hypothetical protein